MKNGKKRKKEHIYKHFTERMLERHGYEIKQHEIDHINKLIKNEQYVFKFSQSLTRDICVLYCDIVEAYIIVVYNKQERTVVTVLTPQMMDDQFNNYLQKQREEYLDALKMIGEDYVMYSK